MVPLLACLCQLARSLWCLSRSLIVTVAALEALSVKLRLGFLWPSRIGWSAVSFSTAAAVCVVVGAAAWVGITGGVRAPIVRLKLIALFVGSYSWGEE